ncbi:MAG: DUF1801 domain-containing protein [Pseudolysinimonas sp.]
MTDPKNTKSGFSAEERAAMKERAKELKTSASKAEALADVLAKIAEMAPAERKMAQRIHELITAAVPELSPKAWYGMPAYAWEGTNVCFFQDAGKFKARYSTFGFNDAAKLDDGSMWPVAYALTSLTVADEKRIVELVKKAVR